MMPLYQHFLTSVVTRARVAGLLALGAVVVIVGFAIGASDTADKLDDGTALVSNLGLALFVPVVTLVVASSVLGDPNEDGTLVYLWLRPVPRWTLAGSSALAALTASLPLVIIPMALAAALTRAGPELTTATIASCALASVTYTGLFTFLGLRVKRAMAWGLAYILVWEGFVANAGAGARFFSVRAHSQSVLSRLADGPSRLVHTSMTTAVLVPLVAAAIATVLTARRLQRQDVA
jgi:ABC-2 type transport system permease protein